MTTVPAALPRGTVTFLFSDMEASTRLLARLGAETYGEVRAAHRRLLRGAWTAWSGHELGT
jgi:class 3 adenylate cyclase